jgi:glycosyltransferase involved in cell wall biosynthesis
MHLPLVSILTPAYRGEFFEASLRSALAQTYANLEIVVCDEGVDPQIGRIVAAVADPRIRYERHSEPLGSAGNLNRCFEVSRGEFIKYLNDDDCLLPECVERLAGALVAQPSVALATARRRIIDTQGNALPNEPVNMAPVAEDAVIERGSVVRAVLECAVNFIGEPTSTLVRRTALERQWPDLPRYRGERFRGFGDLAMWFSVLETGDLAYLAETLSEFRRHAHQEQKGNSDALWLESYHRLCGAAAAAGLMPAETLQRCLALSQLRPGSGTIRYRPLSAPAGTPWRQRDLSYYCVKEDGFAPACDGPDANSAKFSEARYLALNPDVAATGGLVEADTHALLFGARDRRNGIGEDLLPGAPTTRHCTAPWAAPTVDADGALHVCAHRPPVDNLFDGAWPDRRGLADLRRRLLTGRFDACCARCPTAPMGETAALQDVARTRQLTLHGLFEPVVPLTLRDTPRAPVLDDKLLLVGHGARRAGGEMLLLSLMKEFHVRAGMSVVAVLLAGGELETEYRLYGQVYVLGRDLRDGEELDQLFASLRADGYRRAICNTIVTGDLPRSLHDQGFETISLIHELPTSIRSLVGPERARAMARHSDHIVFSAAFVQDAFERAFGLDRARSTVIGQGVLFDLGQGASTTARADLRARLGFPENALVGLGIGVGDLRKGPDLFVEIAARCAAQSPDWHFVWIGQIEASVRRWVEHDMVAGNICDRVRILDNQSDLQPFYLGADAFLLTSREDPFPNVMLDAMSVGLPVLAFDGAGGAPEVLRDGAGLVLPYLDVAAMSEALQGLATDGAAREAIGRTARQRVAADYTMSGYATALRGLFAPCRPKVSVIVPNYNYAQHIEQRLRSIFDQTFPPSEIIVLDDASTDDSVARIEAMMPASPVPIRLVRNAQNSGSVFKQWIKGIRLAAGDLVWVAEADDYCEPTLLAALAHAFCRSDTALAYAQTVFVDADGATLYDGINHTANIDADKWTASYFRTGSDEIRDTLSIRNSIVNASAAIFRKDLFLCLLADGGEAELTGFTVAGDWYAYVRMLEHGSIHFHCEPLNRQRRHAANATSARRGQLFEEVLRVQKFVADRHPVTERVADLIDRERIGYFQHSGIGEAEGIIDYRDSSAFRTVFAGRPAARAKATPPTTSGAAATVPLPDERTHAPPALLPAEEAKLYRRVENLFASGRKDQARQLLVELAERGTVYWEVFNDLGVLAHEEGDIDAAIRYLSIGAGLELSSTNCLRNLLPVLVGQGELGQSLAIAGNLLRREPDPTPVLDVIADLLKAAQPGNDGIAWLSPSQAAGVNALRGERDSILAALNESKREVLKLQQELDRIRNLRRPRSQ